MKKLFDVSVLVFLSAAVLLFLLVTLPSACGPKECGTIKEIGHCMGGETIECRVVLENGKHASVIRDVVMPGDLVCKNRCNRWWRLGE